MQNQIKHFRRFHGYDYSRGAVEFISFGLTDRRHPVFGTISSDGIVHLSPAGKILSEVIDYEANRSSEIELKRFQIMPDHLHLRVYIRPNLPKPLKRLGQFISNIKRWSTIKCNEIGIKISWQENYHDRLCMTRDIIQRVDEYIKYNPRKWALMHYGGNPPMKVFEPLYSRLLPPYEWWSGVGNLQLLDAF